MFARKACYFFVRPKKRHLEVCVFLGRPVKAPQIRRVEPSSKTKLAHVLRLTHRDEVESPVTDWLREAYEFAGQPRPAASRTRAATPPGLKRAASKKKTARRPAKKKV
jgi:hypothetical protein